MPFRTISNLLGQLKLTVKLMRDPEVPVYLKLLPVALLVYFISPIDLLPDALLPGLGFADDLTAIVVGLKAFISLTPDHIVARHSGETYVAQEETETVNGSWRVVDPE